MNLHELWNETWRQLGLTPADDTIEKLIASYGEPGRFYHTAQHLEECFTYFDQTRSLATHVAEVELALWFHDAIYDTRAKDSEEQSARWAGKVLEGAGATAAMISRVRELVLATKHTAIPTGPDACLLVDIDLSILGAPQARFDEYETQVRQEYSWVPEKDFSDGRGKVLQQFLQRKAIYSTEWARAWLETNARANIERSLKRLGFTVAG